MERLAIGFVARRLSNIAFANSRNPSHRCITFHAIGVFEFTTGESTFIACDTSCISRSWLLVDCAGNANSISDESISISDRILFFRHFVECCNCGHTVGTDATIPRTIDVGIDVGGYRGVYAMVENVENLERPTGNASAT